MAKSEEKNRSDAFSASSDDSIDQIQFDFDEFFLDSDPEREKKPEEEKPETVKKGSKKKKRRGFFGSNWTWAEDLIIIAVVLYITFTFIGTPIKVKDNSMAPAMNQSETVLLSRLFFWLKAPSRGDVVRYKVNGEKLFARVVGIPGDTIVIEEDGVVYINGIRYKGEATRFLVSQTVYPLKLNEGEYFLLCDDNSCRDSRYSDVGAVSKKDIQGKVIFTVWPSSAWNIVK